MERRVTLDRIEYEETMMPFLELENTLKEKREKVGGRWREDINNSTLEMI
jgi:hypothetical protein